MIQTIDQLSLFGQVIFLRADFNVPLSQNAGGDWTVADDSRIQGSLPTIRYAIQQGARVVLASHLGRPGGRRDPQYSLEPVAQCLAEHLGQEVTLSEDCFGEGLQLLLRQMKNGQVILLENLRFYPGEEANDPFFMRQLARLGSIYINDAFGVCHRHHASVVGMPPLFLQRGMGFLLARELRYLKPLLLSPPSPFVVLLGGSKVSDKIKTMEALLKRAQSVCVGGAMAHAFLVASQQASFLPEAALAKVSDIEKQAAREVLGLARELEVPVILPVDTQEGYDIGPRTVLRFQEVLASARTLFWNGPLGWFENALYRQGTFEIARFLEKIEAVKVAGGGDTLAALRQAEALSWVDHASTGGGAALKFLEGKELPGIRVLNLSLKEQSHLELSEPDTEEVWEP